MIAQHQATPATPDPTAESGVFDREVHLAHAGITRGSRRRGLPQLVVIYGIMGLAAALFVFSRLVAAALRLPAATLVIAWIIVAMSVLGYLGWWFVRWVRVNRVFPPGYTKTDTRYRVRAIGPADRIDALKRLGPIQDTPFEPQEFHGFMVLPPTAPMVVLWITLSLIVASTVFLMPGTQLALLSFVIYGAFAAGGLAVVFIWPTTVRIVPGRVDVIRWMVFRPAHRERRTLTLRTSKVTVDLRSWYAFIEGPSDRTSLDIWLWPVSGRIELAHSILMGAVSTHRPGPLPDEPPATEKLSDPRLPAPGQS